MLIGSPPQRPRGGGVGGAAPHDGDLVCRAVTQETHHVQISHFAAGRTCRIRFEPGQFLTLELPISSETVFRCYTISSPPTRPETLSIIASSQRLPPSRVWPPC